MKAEESRWKGFGLLYSFADKVDVQLMIAGVIFSLVQAVLPPFVWLIMGDFISLAIMREETKLNKTRYIEQMYNDETGSFNQTIGQYLEKQSVVDAKFADSAIPVFIAMLTLSVSTFIAAFLQRLSWEFCGIRQVIRIKKAYIWKLLNMDVSWLESRHSGQVASMLHNHADGIYEGIADHLPMVVFISAYLLVSTSVCFYIQWDVTLVMFLALPLLIVTRLIFSKWFCKTTDEEQKLTAKMTNLVQETFSCIRTVIAFGAQRQTITKYERLTKEHNLMTEQRLTASSIYDALAQVLLTEFIFTAALCYGMWRVGSENPGRLAALAINMLYMCVTSISIGFHLNGAAKAQENALEMNEIFEESPLIECYKERHKESFICKKAKKRGKITFKDIHFAYPSRPDIEVLKGVSFSVDSGEHVAIVGPSGSGKSTLTALMLRFYDPIKGSVYLDDINLKDMNPDVLRAQIGLVSQEPVLFDGTISDNIRYGRLDATQTEVNEAARKAEAWQFICALPEGMKTRVGDRNGLHSRGTQLSGGQKQRVAIARAVIRSPSVVIFDEATSALDTKHEAEVQKAIDAASVGNTTITIAHRLSTVRNADRIIVLDSGKIIEEGSPEELLDKKDGRFYKMYNDQKLDSIPVPPVKKGSLVQHFSMTQTDIVDAETYRRAWARSSLGAHKRLGKSYSVISTDRKKLALPVMSRKRTNAFQRNIMEVAVEEKTFDDDNILPGSVINFRALWRLIRNYRAGYRHILIAIPITIFRGVFFLLVCFEVSSVLEIALAPSDEMAQQVFITAAVYTALIIIKTMFEAVGRLFVAMYGHGFSGYLRSEMFRKILRHGAAYFDEERNTPGRLVYMMVNDTSTLNRILGEKVDLLLPAVVCSILSVTLALIINWKVALLCGFQFPAFCLFRYVEISETSKRQHQIIEHEKKVADLATVVLSNMSTIKAYTLQEHFNTLFYDVLKPLQRTMRRQSCISAFVFGCQFSFTYILIAITIHFGKIMMLSNEITPFDYLRVVLLTQFGANFISQLIASVGDIKKARTASKHILHVINEKAVDMNNLSDEGLRPRLSGRILLKNVEFRYPSRPLAPVLKDLTFKVAPEESVAIVGPSGSGKSTIISLLQRMYTATNGEVLFDKYDVRQLNPAYLKRVVVSVEQEPTLFSFTIRENIGYGLPEDEATEEKIEQAAKMANIHDFIVSLPQGYNTEVGEFGTQLSGGQKQRIAIARALIREPTVLLLDEATAALDTASEKAVQSALESATKNCTCIHVAHRLSSIRTVSRIIVLVDGEIAEQGTHQELMEQKGLYYEMNQSEM
uniref:ABC transporter ATP-binding protein n=1 Tax=Syphacia muris TaxID=451379 RepID=A0A0N5AVA3_9BILA